MIAPKKNASSGDLPQGSHRQSLRLAWHRVQRRQWWLWVSAITITLALTAAVVSFTLLFKEGASPFTFDLHQSVRGLVGLVFLFDVYTIYKQLQIYRMERQIYERDELFRLISENAADLIAVVDADGCPLYYSPAHQRILGHSEEELHDASALGLVHPDDRERVLDVIDAVRRTGVGQQLDYRLRHRDGRWLMMESTVSLVNSGRGDVEKLVIVNRDVTDRREAEQALRQREEQLRQAQKMEAVGRLSGGIAHDFNNLLGIIIGYGEAIAAGAPQDDPVHKSAEQICAAGQRAAGLTRQLLAFSRQQTLQPATLDLNALISEMGKMLRPLIGTDIELFTELDPSLGRVRADQNQLEQVIMNLAVNARDAMPDGGMLTLHTCNAELTSGHSDDGQAVPAGNYAVLTLKDTGLGMDLETQSHIFEPFYSGKPKGKGTGLGLSTVYGIVRQSNGYILVHSHPGQGTAFEIYLPRVSKPVEAPASETPHFSSTSGSETILVVEDEEALRTLLSDQLSRAGYQVLGAPDGPQALKLAEDFPGRIHMLLTDVVMPGMGGPALAKKLAVSRPDMRVLFMSGYPDREVAPGGRHSFVAEFLQKPFGADTLIQKVRRALDLLQVQDLS